MSLVRFTNSQGLEHFWPILDQSNFPAGKKPFKSKSYKQTPLAQKMLIIVTVIHFWYSGGNPPVGGGNSLRHSRSEPILKRTGFSISLPFATYTLRPAMEDPLSASRGAVCWV